MSIRTRFAPSPTGYLHIGGVRTAMFNWLLTKRLGGQFVLRIDDTDAERNRSEALQPILDGFRWLGIQWDEGPEVGGPYAPYFQSERNQLYVDAAMKLLESGHAYPDYMTKEELDADRKKFEIVKKAYVHRGPHRDTPTSECIRFYQEKPTTLRFKVIPGGEAVINDLICGRCVFKTELIGDPVILRANGTALYNFASTVDDLALKITHIVRAKEHLANTYTQVLLFEALGGPMPQFGHIPLVNYKNKKMSKRDLPPLTKDEVAKLKMLGMTEEELATRQDLNIATVAFYREMGYLPAAVINYLGRLGWSLDDKSEFIPLEQMTANFSLERVTDAPGNFDGDKLYWLQGEYMKLLSVEEKLAGCIPFLLRAKLISEPVDAALQEKLKKVIVAAAERIKLFSDILTYGSPFLKPEVQYDPKSVEKRLKKAGASDLLKSFVPALQALPSWEAPALDKLLHDFATEKAIKPAEMVHPLRVAITGTEVGIGLFDTLEILGREEVLHRIDSALKLV